MRHRVKGKKLGRRSEHRDALMRNLLTSLVLHDAVTTTNTKARALQPLVDRIITTARTKEPREAIRAINAHVYSTAASRKIMEVLKERYKDRSSGYTRVLKLQPRASDGAPSVRIELV